MTVGTRLEDLQAGLRLSGLLPQPVSILAVLPHSPDAVTVTYQDGDGGLGQRLLYRADEASLRIETPASRWQFNADPAEFRLAAEALRIRMAGLHDPMVAVSSSAVDPLPHQIKAVYGELLPRTPLRFLLAAAIMRNSYVSRDTVCVAKADPRRVLRRAMFTRSRPSNVPGHPAVPSNVLLTRSG